ncbi:ran-binding protein M homolog [Silene latifolia]|uniref:ran-binding protein M homolog n=1 Tax=Silene latifolia TaxID=37657 RepID=UPI003D7891CD
MVTNQQEQIGTYFLSQAKLTATSPPQTSPESDTDDEPLPTELNTINSSGGFLVVSTDKLSLRYPSVNLHGHDVGAVQSNRPAPAKRLVYYFEMKVVNAGSKGQMSIGFTTDSFKMRRQPGWEANSYGYHGDDGLLYRGQGKGEPFGPTFTMGDVVGGGINYSSQEVFFTKNGVIVGTVYKDMKSQLFPTVAVHSQNEEVTVNFGKEPFLFDIKAYEAQERLKQQSMIEKITLPQDVSYGIVRSYLLHYGYEGTLNVFDMANNNSVPPIAIPQENGFVEQDSMYALNHRKTLRQMIRSGQIDAVFGKLYELYPQIIQDDKSPVCFLLHCQKFIELVRIRELEGAVKYGRVELAKFFGLEEYEELVRECVALLAYEDPSKSPVGYLLGDSQREVVADTVNAMILSTNPNTKDSWSCMHSQLEKLLRQLTACCLERRFLNGDQGETFYLHRMLQSGKMCKH